MSRVETPSCDVLNPLRSRVGESPLWSVAEQALWWVDIESRALHRHDMASGRTSSWQAEQRIGCIALHADGGLLAAMETGIFHLRPADAGALPAERVANVSHPHDGMRFNDGRCDRSGRFWASTMVRDMALASTSGALFRLDARGLSAPLVPGLITGNGLAFSPRGDVMYLSDSHPTVRRVWAFDLDAEGTPARRREFIDMNQHAGRPDGAAVDADGCYWICGNDGGVLHRFAPDGRLDRSLRVPVSKPSMCAFGGATLDLLFVTSIIPAAPSADELALAGAVFVIRPGVRGLPEIPFNPAGV